MGATIMDFANTPALQPPPGLTPNLVNPSSTFQQALVAVYVTSFILTSIVVPLRLYTKIFIVRSWALEDCEGDFLQRIVYQS